MLQEIKMAHAIRESKMNTNRYNIILKYFSEKSRIRILNRSYRYSKLLILTTIDMLLLELICLLFMSTI